MNGFDKLPVTPATRRRDCTHFLQNFLLLLSVFLEECLRPRRQKAVEDVESVNFAIPTALHLDEYLKHLPLTPTHTHPVLLQAGFVILDACRVCFGCTEDDLTYARQVQLGSRISGIPLHQPATCWFSSTIPSYRVCDRISHTERFTSIKLSHLQVVIL